MGDPLMVSGYTRLNSVLGIANFSQRDKFPTNPNDGVTWDEVQQRQQELGSQNTNQFLRDSQAFFGGMTKEQFDELAGDDHQLTMEDFKDKPPIFQDMTAEQYAPELSHLDRRLR